MNRRALFLGGACVTAAAALGIDQLGRMHRGPTRGAPPQRLADTGLYADFATKALAHDVLAYSPQYPLWTDGASKRRWLRLPTGTSIDASDPDHFVFPIGTQAWKEFSFERRIETRYLERVADGSWIRATYVWSEDGRDARLAPEGGLPGLCTSTSGAPYDVPSRFDCAACHDAGGGEVLGFSALQLSPDRDPLAPNADPSPQGVVDLVELVERGLVRNLPRELIATPPRIAAATPRERAALGYLHSNCGACHNGRGPLASLGLQLDVSIAPGAPSPAVLRTAIDRKAKYCSPRVDATQRSARGDAGSSLLTRRMATREPLLQMPPLGTHAPDPAALGLLTAWIEEDLLAAREDAPPAANETTTSTRSH